MQVGIVTVTASLSIQQDESFAGGGATASAPAGSTAGSSNSSSNRITSSVDIKMEAPFQLTHALSAPPHSHVLMPPYSPAIQVGHHQGRCRFPGQLLSSCFYSDIKSPPPPPKTNTYTHTPFPLSPGMPGCLDCSTLTLKYKALGTLPCDCLSRIGLEVLQTEMLNPPPASCDRPPSPPASPASPVGSHSSCRPPCTLQRGVRCAPLLSKQPRLPPPPP